MFDVFTALVPSLLLILLGAAIKRTDFVDLAFWAGLDRVIYFILMPVLMIHSISRTRLDAVDAGVLIPGLYAALTLLALTMLTLRRLVAPNGPAFTSVFQGAVRFNAIVSFGIVGTLWGEKGIAVLSIITGATIPLINVYCVSVLVRHAGGRSSGIRTLVLSLARNPFIVSVAIGFGLNLTGIGLPGPLAPTFKVLAEASLPLGLMTVGAGISLSGIGRAGLPVGAALVGKHVILPLLVYNILRFLGVDGLPRDIAVIYAAMPCASNAYILARQMGGDATLMAAIVTLSTLTTAVALPLTLWIAQ